MLLFGIGGPSTRRKTARCRAGTRIWCRGAVLGTKRQHRAWWSLKGFLVASVTHGWTALGVLMYSRIHWHHLHAAENTQTHLTLLSREDKSVSSFLCEVWSHSLGGRRLLLFSSNMNSGPPLFPPPCPPSFPAPVLMEHDGLMDNVLPPPIQKPSWHSFNTTTGQIRDRKGGRAAWEQGKRGEERRMCVWVRDVLFVPPVVLWPGCRKLKAFPAQCTSEEITSVI